MQSWFYYLLFYDVNGIYIDIVTAMSAVSSSAAQDNILRDLQLIVLFLVVALCLLIVVIRSYTLYVWQGHSKTRPLHDWG